MSVASCISWILLAIITATIAITLLCKYPAWDSKKKDSNDRPNKPRHEKWFYVWLIGLSALGGFWALFLPLALNQKFDGPNADGNQLRLHLLYITGGVLALTTLGETHRKNTVDREKAKVEKDNYEKSQNHQENVLKEQQRQFNETIAKEREKIEVDKAKNEQDHIRQVHAERRSRYTTAIEQLSNDKASIRLGGVYTLVGLVDEWLTDEKTILSIEERHKEGQVIINNLCAYIRSPFLLAERAGQLDKPYTKDLQKDFGGDKEKFDADKQTFKQHKATLEEERQVRLSIIKEMHEHLHDAEKPGPWSAFNYDFSNTHFFYVVSFNHSYLSALLNFSEAKFTRSTDFSEVKFTKDANFSKAKFIGNVYFYGAEFAEDANFSGAKFAQETYFSGVKFTGKINFYETKFTGNADFYGMESTKDANFSEVKFTKDANFSAAKFIGNADFPWSASFSRAKFIGNTDFSGAKFTKETIFSEAKFTGNTKFSRAKFTKNADFSWAEFTDADFTWAEFNGSVYFYRAEFTGNTDFNKATFKYNPIFLTTLRQDEPSNKAKFSNKVDPKYYNFKVSHDSPCIIETEEKEYDGAKFIIPKGTELFDPDEPSDLEDDDES